MQDKHLLVSDALYQYIRVENTHEDALLCELRELTEEMPEAACQISPDQGAFMQLLAELMGAKRGLEVGTFTGYSSICMARGMGKGSHLDCLDIDEDWTGIAKNYWKKAGLSDRISLHLGLGVETLDLLIAEGNAGKYDYVFIDADKTGYDGYYERCLDLLRPGGVMLLDNMVRDGRVTEPADQHDDDTRAIVALNKKIHADDRVSAVLLGIADGIYLVRKK